MARTLDAAQERREAIKNEGLRRISEVTLRFNVGNITAAHDLRAVYGEQYKIPRDKPSAPPLRKLERIQRHEFIKQNGIRTSPPIVQQFNVSRGTAISDLRAVWGGDYKGGYGRTKDNSMYVNLRLSVEEHAALVAAAQALDCSVSEAVRIAIQEQYLRHAETFKSAVSGEAR